VRRILAAATARGLDATTWQAGAPTPKTSMIVADQVGILFDLFQVADMAYVGGGFERTGLHAVVEPAAFALPTALGPVWRTSLDAAQLVAAGGALPLPRRRPARALADTWRRWLDDPPARKTAGLAARRALQAGAADTTAKAVLRLLATGPAR
jgi:3-deoxy-D-manno-octulosonic-acid transferase